MVFWQPSQVLRRNPYTVVAESPREYFDAEHYRVEKIIKFDQPLSDGYNDEPDGPDGGSVWITTITSRYAIATMRGYPGGGTTDSLYLIPEDEAQAWIDRVRAQREDSKE